MGRASPFLADAVLGDNHEDLEAGLATDRAFQHQLAPHTPALGPAHFTVALLLYLTGGCFVLLVVALLGKWWWDKEE